MKKKDEEKEEEEHQKLVSQSYDRQCGRRRWSAGQDHKANSLERRSASVGRGGKRCQTLKEM